MELPPKHVRYTHTPLDYRNLEIRLLRIEPSSEPTSPIHITIKHVDFGSHRNALARCDNEYRNRRLHRDNPVRDKQWDEDEQWKTVVRNHGDGIFEFTALSYVWGPQTPVHDILVTDHNVYGWFSVRENLYNFLETRKNDNSTWFWVDQICIDQGKNDEKAHQVSQMANIYSAADVEVWLGTRFTGSDELVDLIVREGPNLQPKLIAGRQEVSALIPSFRHFANLPYWSRLWVIQEIVLGRSVRIRIGSKVFSWALLYAPWENLQKAFYELGIPKHDDDLGARGKGFAKRIDEINLRRCMGKGDWNSIVELISSAACYDIRDRVFGAMGLVSPGLRIFPDYSMQLQDILLLLAGKQMKHSFDRSIGTLSIYELEEARKDCVRAAAKWSQQLDNDKNKIDPQSVRHALQKILSVDTTLSLCQIELEWQLRFYIWYKIPNKRSWAWQLVHAGADPLERMGIHIWENSYDDRNCGGSPFV